METDATTRQADHTLTVDSPRAGGAYVVLGHIATQLWNSDIDHSAMPKLTNKVRAQITTWMVNQRKQGNESPELTMDVIERACNGQLKSMMLKDKADRLLEEITSDNPTGNTFFFQQVITDEWQAICEAETRSEVHLLLGYLVKIGCLEQIESRGDFVRVSVDGYERVALLAQTSQYSKQIFVAMWFDDSMNTIYEAIDNAVREAGFTPYRVDRQAFQNKVCDRIDIEIRRSRMVIADFTHGKDGARGSVYFEAGLAHGLGIPLIWTCCEEQIDELHFDTRQYPHIGWEEETLAEFKEQLKDRIELLAEGGST